MLKVFGSLAYYHISECKMEPRPKKGNFMGYGDGVRGFRIWFPLERKLILIRYVIFDELSMLHSKSEEDSDKC